MGANDGICGVGTLLSKATREAAKSDAWTLEPASDPFGRTGTSGSFKVKGDHSGACTSSADGAVLLNKDTLRIDDQPVMESWEKPYKEALADLAASDGGDVLEIGFGLALSANRVQTHKNVTSHTIVEANDRVFEELENFALREEKAGRAKVVPVKGSWVNVLESLKRQGVKYDAILYDVCPQNESEQHLHQFLFMNAAQDLLKSGGKFVYCNLSSIGKLKESYSTWQELWTKSQVPYLTNKLCGFTPEKVTYSLFEFTEEVKRTRGECEYYMHGHALCPVCIKS
eukprot:TRINITY_DN6133_c0_g1_i3.p1 TRINITY_DN6133_c0_g1~~TRINITY_DN6133_c0_g1_i3.p1  ORF type:complete len:285 (-),score=46.54 TRINITY_DN6133_c0_g1_i3:211-1065(-)